MGSFNKICIVSGLPIHCGDETVLIFLKRPEYHSKKDKIGGIVYSSDNFMPCLVPLFGQYDDYGRIEEVEDNSFKKYIEEFFGLDIETIIHEIDDNAVGRGNSKLSCTNKNEDFYSKLTFGLIHRKVYDRLASQTIPSYTEWHVTKNWLELMGFEVTSYNNGEQRYRVDYTHKDLPSNVVVKSDGTYVKVIDKNTSKELVQYCYHPSDFEKEMTRISKGSYKSSITPSMKKMCSIHISIIEGFKKYESQFNITTEEIYDYLCKSKFGKIFTEKVSKDQLLSDEKSLRDTYKYVLKNDMELLGGDRSVLIRSSSGEKNGIMLTGTHENDLSLLKDIDKVALADYYRVDICFSRLNIEYKPSNYGNQDSNEELLLSLNQTYQEIILNRLTRYEYDEDKMGEIKNEILRTNRNLLLNYFE